MKKIGDILKKYLCEWDIHYPNFLYYVFTDRVDNTAVYWYECKECKKQWMQTRHNKRFKVYKDWDGEFDPKEIHVYTAIWHSNKSLYKK